MRETTARLVASSASLLGCFSIFFGILLFRDSPADTALDPWQAAAGPITAEVGRKPSGSFERWQEL